MVAVTVPQLLCQYWAIVVIYYGNFGKFPKPTSDSWTLTSTPSILYANLKLHELNCKILFHDSCGNTEPRLRFMATQANCLLLRWQMPGCQRLPGSGLASQVEKEEEEEEEVVKLTIEMITWLSCPGCKPAGTPPPSPPHPRPDPTSDDHNMITI